MMRACGIAWFIVTAARAMAADPGAEWQAYGNAQFQKGDYAGALKAYDTALKSTTDEAGVQQARGSALMKLGRKDEAMAAFGRSLQLNPGNEALAGWLAAQGQAPETPPEAAGDVTEQSETGRMALAERKFEEAAQAWEGVTKAAPADPAGWAGLGEARYGQGRMAEARKFILKSLSLDREQPKLRQFLEEHLPEGVADAAPAGRGGGAWLSPLWRSALVPGWGQVHNGQQSKGVALGAATLALLGAAAATYLAADASLQEYRQLGPGTSEGDFGQVFSRVEGFALANHVFTLLFYSAYAYNLGDAAANAPGARRLALRVRPDGAVVATAAVRF